MRMKSALLVFFSVFITSLLISCFLWAFGHSPLKVFNIIIRSTWYSVPGTILLLTKMSLLILAGLAVVIPYRAGLFNIGGEGQMIVGGLAAAVVGAWPLQTLGPLHMLLCLICGMLMGAAWAAIAALLKTWRGIHEVIGTIMLNFIALHFVNELVMSVFISGSGSSKTAFIEPSARLPFLYQIGASHLSVGILFSLAIAVSMQIYLYRTWPGFRLRAVGSNPKASAYLGINVNRNYVYSMLIGGSCAGLAGAIQTAGIDHTFYLRLVGGTGFDGIAVAFLALNEPWSTIPAALAIATLRASDRAMQFDAALPPEFIFILEGVLIVCIAIFARRRLNT